MRENPPEKSESPVGAASPLPLNITVIATLFLAAFIVTQFFFPASKVGEQVSRSITLTASLASLLVGGVIAGLRTPDAMHELQTVLLWLACVPAHLIFLKIAGFDLPEAAGISLGSCTIFIPAGFMVSKSISPTSDDAKQKKNNQSAVITRAYRFPEDDVEMRVREIVSKQLNIASDQLSPQSVFQGDLGADSLDLVEMVMAFEDEFGCQIDEEDARRMKSVGDVVDYLRIHKTK